MKVLIFGTGLYYEKSKHNSDMQSYEITGFLDNNAEKVGKMLDGKPIYLPDDVTTLSFDRILIMSSYYPQMRTQLLELGVAEEAIYNYPLGGYEYHEWFLRHKIKKEELKKQEAIKFPFMPLISIIVPTFNTPEKFLEDMITSVRVQSYQNWELCIADGSTDEKTKQLLKKYAATDYRIQIHFLKENLGISNNTNAAIETAKGKYLAFLDHDDMLEPDALFEVVSCLNQEQKPDFIYTDEDKMESNGKYYFWPFFKPDYSPDLLISYAYILHLMVISKELLDKTGRFDARFDGAQDHDMSLRLTEKADYVYHIPKVLYHWRSHEESLAGNMDSKQYGIEADQRAVEKFLSRQTPKGYIAKRIGIGASFQIGYELNEKPLVSIILSTELFDEGMEQHWEQQLAFLSYKNVEIVVGCQKNFNHNMKNIRTIVCDKESSCISRRRKAASESRGKYLLFLELSTCIKNRDYIENLLSFCQRDEIGIVGSCIEDEKGNLLHAGIILGNEIAENYVYIQQDSLYFGRSKVARNLSAISGNGMMIKRITWETIGGISTEYQAHYWDIDLCLKVLQMKKNIIYSPTAKILQTQKNKKTLYTDSLFFRKKWQYFLEHGDPYYNHALSLPIGSIKE